MKKRTLFIMTSLMPIFLAPVGCKNGNAVDDYSGLGIDPRYLKCRELPGNFLSAGGMYNIDSGYTVEAGSKQFVFKDSVLMYCWNDTGLIYNYTPALSDWGKYFDTSSIPSDGGFGTNKEFKKVIYARYRYDSINRMAQFGSGDPYKVIGYYKCFSNPTYILKRLVHNKIQIVFISSAAKT